MSEPSDYGALALARARELPARIAFGVFIAAAAWTFSREIWPLVWFAGMLLAQAVDSWVAAPLRRRPEMEPTLARKVMYGGSLGLSAVVYSSISLHLWLEGGDPGRAFALLVPAGSVLHMSLHMERDQRALFAGWIPHAAWLLAVPLLGVAIRPDESLLKMGLVSFSGVLFLAHVLTTVRRIQKGARALTAARDAAEAERRSAERANAAKSDFLATISHEIRTPMNAMVAAGGLLRRTPLSAEQAVHVAMLEDSTEILMGLLNDVLDLSKIEAGKLTAELADFELVKKLTGTVQLWRPKAEERGVRLEFDPTGLPERIVTDPLRLQQIVFNLLSNAVKFTEAGSVRLSGGHGPDPAGGERFWIEVQDTGCGMSEEAAKRVFAGFEQASAGVARRYGGTGLGLSISRRLAQLLGGELTVASREGEGSTFRLEAPLTRAGFAAAEEAAEETGLTPPVAPAGLRVLAAEDHEVNQKVLRLILEPIGCDLTIVADGRQAVQSAAEQDYDVIILDMQMPVMGGLEAAALIRQGPNRATPIIALTANALQEHREQWAAVGVEMFMTKPVDMQALIETVGRAAAAPRVEPSHENSPFSLTSNGLFNS